MNKRYIGIKALFGASALILLNACDSGEVTGDMSAEMPAAESGNHAVDFTGVWAPEFLYVTEGVAAGVPVVLNNTSWAPLSDGAPEQQQAQTFEERKAWAEGLIEAEIDIFQFAAQNRFQPPYSEAGLAAAEEMRASQAPPSSPYERCLPRNVTGYSTFFNAARLIHKGDLLVALSEDGTVRHIYLDGRDSTNALPSYEGHSVGRFDAEGNLVIETTAYLGTSFSGWPMSSEAKLIETLSLSDDDSELTIKSQYEDPVYLAEPVAQMTYLFRQAEDYELIFTRCIEEVYGAQVFDELVPDYTSQ